MKMTIKNGLLLVLAGLASGTALAARGTSVEANFTLPTTTLTGTSFTEYFTLALPSYVNASSQIGISVTANTNSLFSSGGLDFVLYGSNDGLTFSALSAVSGVPSKTLVGTDYTKTFATYTGSSTGYTSYKLAVTGTTKAAGADSFLINGVNVQSITAVPEPESYAMLLAGLGLVGTIARRRNKASKAV